MPSSAQSRIYHKIDGKSWFIEVLFIIILNQYWLTCLYQHPGHPNKVVEEKPTTDEIIYDMNMSMKTVRLLPTPGHY